jgi:hypothetical protein
MPRRRRSAEASSPGAQRLQGAHTGHAPGVLTFKDGLPVILPVNLPELLQSRLAEMRRPPDGLLHPSSD